MALIDNLVAYWPLDEASGNAIDAHDAFDLTETGGTVAATTGLVDGCRDFEAGDTEWFERANASIGNLSPGNVDFEVCGWIKIESTGINACIIGVWNGGGNQAEWRLAVNTSNMLIFVVSHDGNNVATATAATFGALSAGVWYFVSGYHDSVNNVIGAGVNGTFNTTAHSTGVFQGSAGLLMGALNAGSAHFFDGLQDEFGFWLRLLETAERTDLINSGNGRDYDHISGGGGATTILPLVTKNTRANRHALLGGRAA